ncbi:MAG TPA: zinc ribbon domain-containing protein [Allocoleopsis sp.]
MVNCFVHLNRREVPSKPEDEKTLSTRTHKCSNCGTVLDRDHNAAKNILAKGFKLLAEHINSTEGHSESGAKSSKAQGETDL